MRAIQRPFLCLALALACGPAGPEEPTASGSSGSSGASGSSSSSSSGTTLTPTSGGSTSEGATSEASTTSATTAGPTSEAVSSTSTGASDSSGGSSGGVSPVCEAAALLQMKDPVATPAMGPTWEPGEGVTVGATLFNPGAVDFTDYPGIRVSADHPGVTPAMAENWFFVLFAGMEAPITVDLVAAPDVPAPSTITFTIELTLLNHTCPDLPKLELALEIG